MSTANAAPGANRIKGSVLITRLNMLRQHGGQNRLDEVLKRLPEADRLALRGMILPIAWYPLDMNLRLDTAIADVLSPEDRARAFKDMGRASAEDNLKGAHHVFLRAGEPHFLLSQAAQIYRFYYAVGHRTYEKAGPKTAVIRTFDAEAVTEADCLTIIGWHEKAVEMSGGKNVHIAHAQCRAGGAPHCEYTISWE
jgi:uncharacterized protein (TIGR02265 family)